MYYAFLRATRLQPCWAPEPMVVFVCSLFRYVGVGDDDVVQLFYYFVESQNNASGDPLLFWINGGPGCSGLSGFFFESGILPCQNHVLLYPRSCKLPVHLLCLSGSFRDCPKAAFPLS